MMRVEISILSPDSARHGEGRESLRLIGFIAGLTQPPFWPHLALCA